MTKTLEPATIGPETPRPGNGAENPIFCVVVHFVGKTVLAAIPVKSEPRKFDQSAPIKTESIPKYEIELIIISPNPFIGPEENVGEIAKVRVCKATYSYEKNDLQFIRVCGRLADNPSFEGKF